MEKHNLLAGSGSDSIPSEAEETAYQKTQEAYWEILRKIKLMTDAKIDEIINWVKSESSKNFKGKDVRILKEISPGVMVIMANERDGGIVEKLELAYNTTVVSFLNT